MAGSKDEDRSKLKEDKSKEDRSKERKSKDKTPKQKSPMAGPSGSKLKTPGSTTSRDALLAAAMRKPPTPSFDPVKSGVVSPPTPNPTVQGVAPVMQPEVPRGAPPAPVGADVVGQILGAMSAQQNQQEMLETFFASMGKFMADSAAPTSKKRRRSPSPQPQSSQQEDVLPEEELEEEEEYDDEEEELDEEEGQGVLSDFSANGSSFDPENGKDAWLKMKVGGMMKKWSGNPAASSLTARG